MKKGLLLWVSILLISIGAQAQSFSHNTDMMWFARGGLNMATFAGDGADGMDRKALYSFAYGFQKPIATLGAYWGMDIGLNSRGAKYEELKVAAHNINLSPITVGWKYGITDEIALDGHVGAFLSVDYTGKAKAYGESVSMGDWEDLGLDWNRFDVGMNIGFGIWYDRFNLDFTWQRGFLEVADEAAAYSSNLILRLGVAF